MADTVSVLMQKGVFLKFLRAKQRNGDDYAKGSRA